MAPPSRFAALTPILTILTVIIISQQFCSAQYNYDSNNNQQYYGQQQQQQEQQPESLGERSGEQGGENTHQYGSDQTGVVETPQTSVYVNSQQPRSGDYGGEAAQNQDGASSYNPTEQQNYQQQPYYSRNRRDTPINDAGLQFYPDQLDTLVVEKVAPNPSDSVRKPRVELHANKLILTTQGPNVLLPTTTEHEAPRSTSPLARADSQKNSKTLRKEGRALPIWTTLEDNMQQQRAVIPQPYTINYPANDANNTGGSSSVNNNNKYGYFYGINRNPYENVQPPPTQFSRILQANPNIMSIASSDSANDNNYDNMNGPIFYAQFPEQQNSHPILENYNQQSGFYSAADINSNNNNNPNSQAIMLEEYSPPQISQQQQQMQDLRQFIEQPVGVVNSDQNQQQQSPYYFESRAPATIEANQQQGGPAYVQLPPPRPEFVNPAPQSPSRMQVQQEDASEKPQNLQQPYYINQQQQPVFISNQQPPPERTLAMDPPNLENEALPPPPRMYESKWPQSAVDNNRQQPQRFFSPPQQQINFVPVISGPVRQPPPQYVQAQQQLFVPSVVNSQALPPPPPSPPQPMRNPQPKPNLTSRLLNPKFSDSLSQLYKSTQMNNPEIVSVNETDACRIFLDAHPMRVNRATAVLSVQQTLSDNPHVRDVDTAQVMMCCVNKYTRFGNDKITLDVNGNPLPCNEVLTTFLAYVQQQIVDEKQQQQMINRTPVYPQRQTSSKINSFRGFGGNLGQPKPAELSTSSSTTTTTPAPSTTTTTMSPPPTTPAPLIRATTEVFVLPPLITPTLPPIPTTTGQPQTPSK